MIGSPLGARSESATMSLSSDMENLAIGEEHEDDNQEEWTTEEEEESNDEDESGHEHESEHIRTTSAASTEPHCVKCNKTSSSIGGTLKQCARCKEAKYCNAECQKAHWLVHKSNCHPPVDVSNPDKLPFHAINQNKFLHNRPEIKTFQLLIDCLRLRQEDEFFFEGELMSGTIYNEQRTSAPAFKQFLGKSKRVPGLLPPWWTEVKANECVAYGLQRGHNFGLHCVQEKSSIQEEWKDNQMPMKLRMIAERVYGYTPGGTVSEGMMQLMLMTERK